MRYGTRNGKECEYYDFNEICEMIKYKPPKYCNKDAAELQYCGFYDSLDRFTLKAGCPKCYETWALPLNEKAYEDNMLKHWTKKVKDRAGDRCEVADEHCAGPLHAHHIVPKHLDPSRKFDLTNGICVCEAHHKMIHSYM